MMGDHRFERTDNEIKRTFIQELLSVSFEDMTITKLANACLIERTTFYSHYESLYTLAAAVIDDQLKVIEDFLVESLRQHNNPNFHQYQFMNEHFVEYFNANRDIIQKVRLIPLGTNSFDARCRRLFKAHYSRVISFSENSFTIYLMVNLAMSDVDYVLNNGHAPSLDELRKGLKQMNIMLN
ncbi:TetR/AcrR family transcriptional regulator [Agrilactobacillus yilanensis]|uniref:TetR/AcrR family transcriptional regulator n=1 Tax=Agrilactobacillus yilanensis TaxID=2485997 RepID=A0ABW4JCI5_9LACO|nr:TetR/AcrR family transcriptional regulator [Agrilactobacillus yilanensis]